MFKIKQAPKEKYTEIFQSLDVKFSFCKLKEDNTLEELFAPVKCKDFLGDVLHAEHTQQIIELYNFKYDGKTQQIDRDKTRLLLYFPTLETSDIFSNNLSFLWDIEFGNGLTDTQVYLTDNPKVVFVEADPFWLSAIWRISLYSFLLKAMCYKYNTNDWIEELREMDKTESQHLNYNDKNKQFHNLLVNLHGNYSKGIYIGMSRYIHDVHETNGVFSLLSTKKIKEAA